MTNNPNNSAPTNGKTADEKIERDNVLHEVQSAQPARSTTLDRGESSQARTPAAAAMQADGEFKRMFERALPSISEISSRYLRPDRLLRIALIARSKTPGLRRCTPQSFLQALMQAAEVGLEPNTPLEHAWLIPYRNKNTGSEEAQFQIGYKGYVHMARRSGVIVTARARLVHANDFFDMHEGTDRKIIHKPAHSDRGEVVYGYAIAELVGGGVEWDTMPVQEMDAARQRSRAGDSGPWVSDRDSMRRKTVLRKMLKQLDLTEEITTAVRVDESADDLEDADATVIDLLAGGRNEPAEAGKGEERGRRRK